MISPRSDADALAPALQAVAVGDLAAAEAAATAAYDVLGEHVALCRLLADIRFRRRGPQDSLDWYDRARRLATAAAGRALAQGRTGRTARDPETGLDLAAALSEAAHAERQFGQCLHETGRSRPAEAAFARWAALRDRLSGDAASTDRRLVLQSDLAAHIGETGAQLDCHLKLALLGLIDPRRPVVPVGSKVGNRHFLELWRNRVDLKPEAAALALAEGPQADGWDPKLPLAMDGRGLVHPAAWPVAQQAWEDAGRAPLVRLSDTDREAGWRFLHERVGLAPGDWFIALHMRDPAYKRETGRHIVGDDHRHQSPEPTLDALSEITGRGGWVVRLGHPDVPPIPAADRLFDYARSGLQAPWLDSFFCAEARFFLGTASGPFSMAAAFGTPVAASNWIPLSLAPPSRDHLFTFKRLRHRATGRWLTAAEMLQDPLRHAQRAWLYEERDIEIVENDADDIRGLIRERLDGPDPEVSPEETVLGHLFEASGLVLNARPAAEFLRRHGDSLGVL